MSNCLEFITLDTPSVLNSATFEDTNVNFAYANPLGSVMAGIDIKPKSDELITVNGATFTNVNSDESSPAISVTEAQDATIPSDSNVVIQNLNIVSSISTKAPIGIKSPTTNIKIEQNNLPLSGFAPTCKGLVNFESINEGLIQDTVFTKSISAIDTCDNVLALHFSGFSTGSVIISKCQNNNFHRKHNFCRSWANECSNSKFHRSSMSVY